MKKIVSFALLLAMLVSSVLMVSCGENTVEAKLGLGFVESKGQVDPTVKDGKDVAGSVKNAVTVAATLFDADGKLTSVDIDVLEASVSVDKTGTVTVPSSFKSKRELGYDYSMKAFGSKYEWFEQAEIFERYAIGKTVDEIKALLASDGKAVDGIQSAGCTIAVSDFVNAIEASANNLKAVTVAPDSSVNAFVSASAICGNASSDVNGKVTINHSFAATVGSEVATGSASATFLFDNAGKKVEAGNTVEAKLGLGIVEGEGQIDPSVKDGADVAGSAKNTVTVAATLFGADGRLISIDIDVLEASVAVDKNGVLTIPTEFKSKRELGYDYGMKAYAGSKYEWFEQIDALENLAKGKTLDEIKTLMGSDYKGNTDVQAAGCTIFVSDFINAIEASVSNQKTVNVAPDAKVSVSVSATADGTNATASANGTVTINHSVTATAGTANATGTAAATFAFTAEGKKPSEN